MGLSAPHRRADVQDFFHNDDPQHDFVRPLKYQPLTQCRPDFSFMNMSADELYGLASKLDARKFKDSLPLVDLLSLESRAKLEMVIQKWRNIELKGVENRRRASRTPPRELKFAKKLAQMRESRLAAVAETVPVKHVEDSDAYGADGCRLCDYVSITQGYNFVFVVSCAQGQREIRSNSYSNARKQAQDRGGRVLRVVARLLPEVWAKWRFSGRALDLAKLDTGFLPVEDIAELMPVDSDKPVGTVGTAR
jgi:hypothetical protein